MTKLIYCVLLCHFIAAFAALGMPLFLPMVLPTLGAHIDSDWAGILFILPTFCTAVAARFWGQFADKFGRRRSLIRAQLGLAAGFALCGLADNLTMFVFGLIVQGTFGGTMAASNSYLSSQIKDAKTLGTSLNKTQLSARLALIVAPIGLGWTLSDTSPLNAYLWLSTLPLLALAITLTLPADNLVKSDVEKEAKDQTTSQREQTTHKPLHKLYWVFGAQFCFAFSMVVTFPYFSPFVQQYGVTNQAWIGFLYALPHGVYLLFAGKVHLFSERLNRRHPLATLYLGFGLLSVSTAMHLIPDQTTLIIARVVFGLGMVCCYQGLHQALANQIDRQQSGKIFSRFDAMSKWGGVAAGLSASVISSLGWLEVPFLLSTLISFSTAIAMIILSKFGHRHVKHSFISN
ncbi:Vibrioferrin membrane-spanning transport protein PvsC [Vibrio chagasii]|uniref:MFS transporter n=1 Tax=Vibrio chagasii TaxID=170679 RepID=UPI003384D6C8|nr:Vibrioferrin membrane-spanning transport protein PvsC [Vibrio chagasii]CAH6818447.1 Vibrioferrin membrane-spanning transport protein PvsC [Vibrio chagasii]CAH6822296.1 Vibrioferrin membrane-spanning transport protein PvsC [Vibrio chagasii]CAH6980059.1 Vibrioferrin membrane-spanning transport protein PvsC [Vibrio chagasii]CAH7034422.1 Vibrioferrin membrane-spanning transport protein PvsC [Vibrio chagasii]